MQLNAVKKHFPQTILIPLLIEIGLYSDKPYTSEESERWITRIVLQPGREKGAFEVEFSEID